MYRAWSRSAVLYISDGAGRDQDQYEDNKQRQDCPGQFNLVAAIDLGWLARVISKPLAKSDDSVDKQTCDDQKDGRANSYHQQRDVFDLLSRLRQRFENVRNSARIAKNGLNVPCDDDPNRRERQESQCSTRSVIERQTYPRATFAKSHQPAL